MKEERPILQLERTPVETLLDVVAVGAAVGCVAVVAFNYGQLPETVATHFGASGEPNDWSSKATLWVLCALSLVLVVGMIFLCRFPHKFNYTWKITPKNAAAEYRRARVLLRVVNVGIAGLFLFVTWKIVNGALEGAPTLGKMFLPIVLIVSMLPGIVYLLGSSKKIQVEKG